MSSTTGQRSLCPAKKTRITLRACASTPPADSHRYAEAKELGIFQEVGEHEFAGVNAGEIMGRILKQRELYEERQRRKGVKAADEDSMVN